MSDVQPNPCFGTPQTVSSSGDTAIYTPQAGKRVRLIWAGLTAPSTNTADVVATLKWDRGANPNIYTLNLSAPGAFAHRTRREGPRDGVLVLNLNAAQTVQVNLDVEEIQ